MAKEKDEDQVADVTIVLDCRDASTFNPLHVRAFKNTPRGKELARNLFLEWVESIVDEKIDKEQLVNDGLYETGDGFIAMIHTN